MLLFPVVLDNVKKLDFLSCESPAFSLLAKLLKKKRKNGSVQAKCHCWLLFSAGRPSVCNLSIQWSPPPTAPQRHSGTCSEKERGIRGAAREGRSLGLEPELEVFSSVQNQVSEKKVKQEKDAAEQSIRSRDTASGTPQSEESAFLDTGAGAAGALLRPSKQSKTLRGIK